MTTSDPLCRICQEPQSAHVLTPAGPLTHPREARGEGRYVLAAAGTDGYGVHCSMCRGPCDGHPWTRYTFVETAKAEEPGA